MDNRRTSKRCATLKHALFQFDVDETTCIYKTSVLGENVVVGGTYSVMYNWGEGRREELSGKVLALDGKKF